MQRLARFVIGGLLFMLGTGPSAATTVESMPLAQLVDQSTLIVRGEVVDVRSAWSAGPDRPLIVTTVVVAVERVLKGGVGRTITFELLGGTVGDSTLEVSGQPVFAISDRAVLFLRTGAPFVSPVVGFGQGRFRITTGPDGDQHVVTDDGWGVTPEWLSSGRRATVSARAAPAMRLADFETMISRLQGGRPSPR